LISFGSTNKAVNFILPFGQKRNFIWKFQLLKNKNAKKNDLECFNNQQTNLYTIIKYSKNGKSKYIK